MTFSIIVVCLNEGEKLHKTVKSILNQTEDDYEIIVKDGGSTDDSVEGLVKAGGFTDSTMEGFIKIDSFVDENAEKTTMTADDESVTGKQPLKNGRCRIYREPDSGIYDAMNQAVKHASGEYILFLNCGDYFYQDDVLSKVKRLMEEYENKAGTSPRGWQKANGRDESRPLLFYGNIRERMTGALVQSNPKMDDFGCYRNVPCHQACFYDRKLFASRGFDTGYRVRADYEHFLWCFYKAGAHTVYLPVTVASYEGGGFSETGENIRTSAKEHRQIVSKYMPVSKVMKYRLLMMITLAPVRTHLARNPVTAGMYQTCKRRVYEVYRRISGKKR